MSRKRNNIFIFQSGYLTSSARVLNQIIRKLFDRHEIFNTKCRLKGALNSLCHLSYSKALMQASFVCSKDARCVRQPESPPLPGAVLIPLTLNV